MQNLLNLSPNPNPFATITLSPAAVLGTGLGVSAAVGCLPSVSVQNGSGSSTTTVHAPMTLEADDLFIRCDDAVFRGAQIRARLLEAIVTNDLTIETLADEFRSDSHSSAISVSLAAIYGMVHSSESDAGLRESHLRDPRLGAVPTMRFANEREMTRKIDELAELVGTERFYLTVGNLLRKKSALVGLAPDGVVTHSENERIEAGRVLEEKVAEAHSHKRRVFNPSIGELFEMMDQIDEFNQLRNKIQFEELLAKKSREERKQTDREVKAFLDEPEVRAAGAKLRVVKQQMLENSERMRQLEAENPELAEKIAANDPLLKVDSPESAPSSSSSDPSQELEALFEWSRARHAFEQQKNEVIEQMAIINEKLDSFAESHPTIAKYSDKIIEGLGTAAMGLALFAGPEITTATVLTNGATLLTYGKLFDALIEGGSEKFVDYCALQGRTESEAERYGAAAAGIVRKLLKLAIVRGGIKVVGGKKGGTVEAMNKAEASARAKEVFRAKAVNENVIRTEVNQGIFDAVNIYKGGAYNQLPMIPGFERHHIPADSVTSIPRGKGMSIQMELKDHRLTSSWGSSTKARQYREELKQQIDHGDIRGAVARDIRDVKDVTGRKYNSALREMLEYGKNEGIIPSNSIKNRGKYDK